MSSPFRGLGQYYDSETRLSCTRYRYWEAETGRWLSADPLRIWGGLNLFGFDGCPTQEVDPLGLAKKPCQTDDDLVTIYRQENTGPHTNQRLRINEDGSVTLLPPRKRRDPAVHISLENPERTQDFLATRQSQRPGAPNTIRQFQVPRSVADRVTRNAAVQSKGTSAKPGRPLIVDEPHEGQYAVHSDDMQTLVDNAVPGSASEL